MNRTFVGLLFAALTLVGASQAEAQVVIQGQGQAGGVYGQGTVYVQPAQTAPSPYVATAPAPAPVRTIVHTSPTMGLLVPGIIALGAGWLIHGIGSLSIVQDCSSYLYSCPSDGWAGLGWIPILGPWLAYGIEYTGGYDWFNILFGVIQGAGTILTILGVAIQQEWEEVIAGLDLGNGVRLAFDGGPRQGGAQLGASLTF